MERVPRCTVEEMVEVLVPQMREQNDEAVKVSLKSKSTRVPWKKSSTTPVPEVVKLIQQERLQNRMLETPEETGKVMKLTPQDQMQDRTLEHFVAELVPQIQEELVDAIRFIPRGRTSECVVRQTNS